MPAFQIKPVRSILVYDPSTTSNELVCAAAREAGFDPLPVANKSEAADTVRDRGPAGDESLAGLVLDASTDIPLSDILLRTMAGVPGAESLLALLLVDPNNPTPLPSAAGLPSMPRPFSREQLVAALRETFGHASEADSAEFSIDEVVEDAEEAGDEPDAADADVAQASDDSHDELPALRCELALFPLHAALHALQISQARGIILIEGKTATLQFVIRDGHLLRANFQGDEGSGHTSSLGTHLLSSGASAERASAWSHEDALAQVEGGTLDAASLMTAIQAHAWDLLHLSNTWPDAILTFWPREELGDFEEWCASQSSPPPPALGSAVLACMQHAEDLLAGHARAMEFDQVFIRSDAAIQRVRAALDEEELQVLEQINGQRSLKEVARKSGYGSFAVAKIVTRLTHAGVIEHRASPTFV